LDVVRAGLEGALGDGVEGALQGTFKGGRRLVVHDDAAAFTDEMVVMVGEHLREFVASVLFLGDESTDDAGLLQDGEVAVDAADREAGIEVHDFGSGEGPVGGGEDDGDDAAAGGVALAHGAQAARDGGVEVDVDLGSGWGG